jgi:hypothetical protein
MSREVRGDTFPTDVFVRYPNVAVPKVSLPKDPGNPEDSCVELPLEKGRSKFQPHTLRTLTRVRVGALH